MNYLSHFYFETANEDSYYVLGVALPDLVKNYNRRWNLHPEKRAESLLEDNTSAAIYKGWQKHLLVDDYFHNSEYFKQQSGTISKAIRSLSLENSYLKPFMVGHIGLELILDTLLIKNNMVDAGAFYSHLEACKLDDIERFIAKNGIENAGDFRTFYQRFKDIRYLQSYKNNESLVYALNRIQYRLSGKYLPENDIYLLQKTIQKCMDDVEKDYLSVFKEIEWKIKS